MKDLILIGAYCPDIEREILLNNCIDSLQKIRDQFDILVCSHSIVPEYIGRKVDYVFYDKNNDLINEMEYMNQPWFSPYENMTIHSTFVSNYSTYFSAYRIFIGGIGIGKTFGYKKIHYIEYDSVINDHDEITENSKLLENYDTILIKKDFVNYEENIPWAQGFLISMKVETIDETFKTYDKKTLLNLLLESGSKTNEKITEDILTKNKNVYIKNYDNVAKKNNKFNLSRNINENSINGWYVPFYNKKNDIVQVIVWNKKPEPVNVIFIVNNEKIISISDIKNYEWSMRDISRIEDINSIITLVNGKKKNEIIFDENNREIFKITNYSDIN